MIADTASPPAYREFLLRPDGILARVVTVEGELVPWDEWQRQSRPVRRCACGRVCGAPSARTCGDLECVRRLSQG
jgi:hypothetical protein